MSAISSGLGSLAPARPGPGKMAPLEKRPAGVGALGSAAADYLDRPGPQLAGGSGWRDAVFIMNRELPSVSNVHQATRVIECNPLIVERDASWRIDFPRGTTLRGTASSVGQWPAAVDAQPPSLRVLTLGASGDGVVALDNSEQVDAMLSDYNSSVPFVAPGAGGGCSLAAPGDAPGTRSLAALGALLGAAALLQSRRARRGRARR